MADIGIYKMPMHCLSISCVFSDIMGRAADLSEVDKVQIVLAGYLKKLISKMAHLVDCSRAKSTPIKNGVWMVKQRVVDYCELIP
ncbi:hypothetical protein TNCV_968831 [Trichonephila clavipes]|nr:hypothetical protein TNCV_968831 [Trichonephila clavipes]